MLDRQPSPGGSPVEGWSARPMDPRFAGLVPPDARLLHLATGATWSEGPVWLPDSGTVVWSDIPGNRLLRWSPDGTVDVFLAPSEFQNGHTLDHDGSILACSHGNRRIERVGLDGTVTTVVDRYGTARLNSPNDLVVKSDGTIWFSDPPYGIIQPHEGHPGEREYGDDVVFRYDPATGGIEVATDWVEEPNGLAFSPDESILYVADTSAALRTDGTGNRHIVAFDVVDGRRLANPRVLYALAPGDGLADGFRVDGRGNIWTSAEDGIHVVAPDGTELGRVPVPERVSNCVFGGEDGTRLFITAGTSLYAIDVAVRGATAGGAS